MVHHDRFRLFGRAVRLAILAVLGTSVPAVAQAPADDELRARVDSLVRAEMELRPVPGATVAVIRGSDTLAFRGWGRADVEHGVAAGPRTVYQIASITKQFTAAAVLRLADRGVLSLDDPLERWVPDFSTGGRTVRLRHLLNHTSGIPDYYGFPGWQEIRRVRMDHDRAREAMRGLVTGEPFDFEPGAGYAYSNAGYDLLGDVVEAASGRRYHDYLRTELLEPLGLGHVTGCPRAEIVPHRARGYDHRNGDHEGGEIINAERLDQDVLFASGSLCATAGDLVRWNRALHEERSLLSDSLYRRMTTPEGAAADHGYAFGLGAGERDGHPFLGHNGSVPGFSSQVRYYPEERLHVVVLMNAPAAVATLAEEIERAVLGLPSIEVAHRPPGWQTRPLEAGADTGRTSFRTMGPGLHVTSGPDAVYTHPDSLGRGPAFRVQATLVAFTPPDSETGRSLMGLVLGLDPEAGSPAGLHFLIRAPGEVRVVRLRRDGSQEELVGWTPSGAVSFPEARHQARNALRVQVDRGAVRFLVNDTEVAALDRDRVGSVRGPAGVRIGRDQDVHIGGFGVGRER